MVSLLNTSLLPWLLAASIPLVIHLLTRRARRRLDLPTVRFLARTLAQQSRLFRWRHLLLLLLRTLAVATLILVFLKPQIEAPLAAPGAQRVGAVVVLDVSASMGYSAGGMSTLAKAKSQAIRALQGLRSGDRANVVFCAARSTAVLKEPTDDLAALMNAVKDAQVTEERAEPAAAMSLAVEQLAKANAPDKRIIVLSDFQRTNWADVKPDSLGQDTHIVFVNADSGVRDNAGITAMRTRPAAPRVRQPMTVECDVFNGSAGSRSVPVTLTLSSGQRFAQSVTVGPYSTVTVGFPLQFEDARRIECTASIPRDNYALDDTRRSVIDLRQMAVVVLITDEDAQKPPSAAYFLSRALSPSRESQSGFVVVPVRPAGLNNPLLQRADVVVVCGAQQVPAAQYGALARYAGGGGNLVWFLYGDQVVGQMQALAAQMPLSEPIPFTVDGTVDLATHGKGYVTLAEARYESPFLKAFKDPAAADLARTHFRRFCLTGEVDPRAEVLLKLEDGTAAAVRATVGSGNLLLLNMAPSPAWSDLARQESFLPLMHEFLKGLLSRDLDVREIVAGAPAGTTIATPGRGRPFVVACAGPQGPVPVAADAVTGSVVIDQTPRAGFYRLSLNGSPVAAVGVNPHPDESDMRAIDPRELESPHQQALSYLAGTGERETSVDDLQRGRPLWPHLLVATIVLLFAEQCLGRVRPRVGRARR